MYLGLSIRGDQPLHHFHGLLGTTQLVVRTRLLIEHLVAVRVGRVLRKQLVVQLDRFQRAGLLGTRVRAVRQDEAGNLAGGGDGLPSSRAQLQITFQVHCRGRLERVMTRSLRAARFDFRRGIRCRHGHRRGAGRPRLDFAGAARCGDLDQLAFVTQNSVFLLELQVCETPHGFRGHRVLRGLLEEATVALHCLDEAFVDLHFLRIRRYLTQAGQSALIRIFRTAGDYQSRRYDQGKTVRRASRLPPVGLRLRGTVVAVRHGIARLSLIGLQPLAARLELVDGDRLDE